MPRSYERFRGVWVVCCVAFAALSPSPSLAQPAGPANASNDGPLPLPAASIPAGAPTPREAQLEERIRQLELVVDRLQRKFGAIEPGGTASSQPDSVPSDGGFQGSGLPPSEPGVTPVARGGGNG